jgi:NRAMP (natural resistance-associated macrophage protein)-like metal ion transporter
VATKPNEPDVTGSLAKTTQGAGEVSRPRRRNQILLYLSALGPGLIAANAGNDAGGIATYSTMGSQFGFNMLWVMIIVGIGVAVVQEMCARMGAVTGKGLSDLIRENFSLRLTAFVLLSFLIANSGVIITEFIGIASALDIFGIPPWLGSPIAGVALWFLVARGSYGRVEKVFLGLTVAFFAYIFAAFLAHPDLGELTKGTLIPHIEFNGGYIATLVAAVGTTISPYMQIYIQSAVVERGVTTRDYKYERFEVFTGSAFSIVIAYFIIVATAATIFTGTNGQGKTLGSAAEAAQSLAPFLGDFAKYIFALGLLGASFLAAGVLPLTTCYSLTEGLGLENGVSKSWKQAPIFWGIFTILIAIGVLVAMIPDLPVISILLNLYILNGLILPIILFSVLNLVNNRELMGNYVNGRFFNILAYGLTIIVSLLSLFYLLTQVLGIFGISILPAN